MKFMNDQFNQNQGFPQQGYNPNIQGNPQQGFPQQGFDPNIQGFGQQGQQMYNNPYMNQQPQMINPMQQNNSGGKGKLIIFAILIIVFAIIVALVLKNKGLIGGSDKGDEQVAQFDTSAYDNLITALNNYNADSLDLAVGTEEGDSYLAQEWAYVNRVSLREEFIQKISGIVKASYPQGVDLSNGGAVTFTIPDYKSISTSFDETTNKAMIEKLFKSSEYSEKDYTWQDEMNNLFCQFVIDNFSEVPTTQVELTLPVTSKGGQKIIADDSELDKALFSSQEFHDCISKFSQICLGYTGFKDEKYKTREKQKNKEYDDWYKLFKKYYDEDNGHFHKGKSKWEPWYKRDDDNNIILDENGEKVVNYYSVKKKDGTDWIQPDQYVMVEVEKTRQVEDPWIDETGCTFVFLGTYYIQNEYTGENDTTFRVGDGSWDFPAGINTTIITKAPDTKGKWHDVRVALTGFWTGQDAIDYAEQFDKRNRGFTTESVISLITYEVSIENLEDKTIDIVSDMSLFDKNSNKSSRTGTMYGFTQHQKIKPHEKIIINDWATSTELDQKYVGWGKTFDRTASIVYFNILAGTGYIPHYSAYEYFTGQSTIDEGVVVQNTTNNGSDVKKEEETIVDDDSSNQNTQE